MDIIWSLFAMPFTTLRKFWLHVDIFLHSLRHSRFTLPVEPEFLQSSSFNYINPRHHVVATDDIVQHLPAATSAWLDGLSDEQVLALFTHGFFAGPVFGPERFILSTLEGWNLLPIPARYTGPSVHRPPFPSSRSRYHIHTIPLN